MTKTSLDLADLPTQFQHIFFLFIKATSIEPMTKGGFWSWKKDNIWSINGISCNLLSQSKILTKNERIFLKMIAYLINFILYFLHFLLLFHQFNMPLISLLCLSVLEYIYFVFHSIFQFFIFSSVFSHFLLLCCGFHLQRCVLSLNIIYFRSQHNILILKRNNNFRILIVNINHRGRYIRSNRLCKQPSMRHALQIRHFSRLPNQISISFKGINKK